MNFVLGFILFCAILLLIDGHIHQRYRIVEVSGFKRSQFKIQQKGFLKWRDIDFAISPYSDICYFETYDEALYQIKILKKQTNKVIKITEI